MSYLLLIVLALTQGLSIGSSVWAMMVLGISGTVKARIRCASLVMVASRPLRGELAQMGRFLSTRLGTIGVRACGDVPVSIIGRRFVRIMSRKMSWNIRNKRSRGPGAPGGGKKRDFLCFLYIRKFFIGRLGGLAVYNIFCSFFESNINIVNSFNVYRTENSYRLMFL
jgi:hypothetical protein